MNIRNKLTVKDFIEVLKTFPQSWEISIGDGGGEESYPVKGVFQTSETDFEMPSYSYAYVQIEPFNPFGGLDLDDILSEESVEMFGDRNWYNTGEVYERRFKNGIVSFHLTDEGNIEVVACRDFDWNDMSLEDIEEYTCDVLIGRGYLEDLDNLENAIETVRDEYKDNSDVQEAIQKIVELKRELSS